MSEYIPEGETRVESGVTLEEELREPSMYRVILHNDDFTTMDFVVMVLMEIFRKSADEAETITATKYWPSPTYGELLFGIR